VLSCVFIKSDGSFPLVSDTNSRHVFRREVVSIGHFVKACLDGLVNLFRVVLNPPGFRSNLGVTSSGYINNFEIVVNNEYSGACSSLIDSKNVFAKVESSLLREDRVVLKSTKLRY
jgi:hypothetical protein